MLLNLNDPDSIVSWWQTFPQRHGAYLDFVATRSPQFGPAIHQARRKMRSDPKLRALLEQAVAASRAAAPEAALDPEQAAFSAYRELAH